ncbi:MAG: MATE family efflux transporter [Peptostreptococcaceae bacterium]
MNDFTRGNETKSIFFFALPMLIGSVFQQLYNICDTIIVGQFLGKDAMAAVSSSGSIMFLIISLLSGIGIGFSILVSQYFGSKDMKKVKMTIDTIYVFIFFGSIIFSIFGIIMSKPLLNLINTPPNILDQSKLYLNIIFGGLIFSAGYNTVSSILRGLGDSKTPLYFLIISTIINIILDIIFILVFNMGVEAVSLATIISQGVSLLCSMIYLNKKHDILKFNLKNIIFDKDIFKQGLHLGLPSGIQQTLFSVGAIAVQSLINEFGVDAIAAGGICYKIEDFIALPIMNLGSATSTFVAQNVGAREFERVKKGVLASIKISAIMCFISFIILMLFSDNLIKFFNTDLEVIRIGSINLKITAPFFIFIGISFILNNAMRGAGDSIFPLISSMLSLWIIRVPFAYLFSRHFGIHGVYMGIVFAWFVGALISGIYFLKGKWREKIVINEIFD